MELVKVSEHVYYVQGAAGMASDNEGFISNAGVIITADGVVLLDALGTPSLADLLLSKIRKITDKPISKVIVTHYHADHIYGLQVFKKQGAEIIAPTAALDYLASEQAKERLEERRFSLEPWVNESTHVVTPDKLLSENTSFEFGAVRFNINQIGAAHSEGDMTLFIEPDNVLFSGDIIFEGRIPYLGDANTRSWLAALRKMETSKLAALVPGHGPIAREPNKAIQATSDYLAFMREHMGKAAQDFIPFAEAYKNTDWSAYKNVPAFEAANRRNAYQVFLSMEAEIMSE
jgi:glyoxylase-like metal-dependent hydrolase (beta-lactamase superfamily II)